MVRNGQQIEFRSYGQTVIVLVSNWFHYSIKVL